MAKTAAVIPAYNEARHISRIITGAKKYVDLVIVVDDGSTDSTFKEAASADILSRHIINLGKGSALRTGFELALKNNADVIITMDSDGQNNPADIPRFIRALNEGKSDIVVGARSFNKNMPFIFRLGNIGLRKIFQFLFGLKIHDTQSGYRAFKAENYQKIKWQSTDYSVEAEMLANAGKHKLKVAEIPIATRYLNRYKGTTIIDGISIFFKMLVWKLRR